MLYVWDKERRKITVLAVQVTDKEIDLGEQKD